MPSFGGVLSGIGSIGSGLRTGVTDFTRGMASAQPGAMNRRLDRDKLEAEVANQLAVAEAKVKKERLDQAHKDRNLELQTINAQSAVWLKLLPVAIESEDPALLARVQKGLGSLQAQAAAITEGKETEYQPGTVPPEPDPATAEWDRKWLPKAAASEAGAPSPSTEPAVPGGPEPKAGAEDIDLSGALGSKSKEHYSKALDEAKEWYDDSNYDIDDAMERVLIDHPDLTDKQQGNIRRLVEATAPPSMSEEEIAAYAKVAAEAPELLSNMRSRDRAPILRSMVKQGLLPTKSIPPSVIDKMTDFDVSLHELASLTGLVEGDPGLFGPFAGWFFPMLYGTQVRIDAKNVISRLDDVRQTVGKAKEGGVLRKEDEEKYKRILPNIQDEPEVALFKVQSILKSLKFQRDRYIGYVKQAGMYVNMEQQAPLLPVDPKTASLKEMMLYAVEWPELGEHIAKRFPEEHKRYIAPKMRPRL